MPPKFWKFLKWNTIYSQTESFNLTDLQMDENGAIDAEAVIAMLPDEIQSKVAGTIRICADVSKYL